MPSHFGPRVIGQAAYAAQMQRKQSGAERFGPRVVDRPRAEQPTAKPKPGPRVVAKDAPAPDSVSVEQLREILLPNPSYLDSLFEAELARPEGARIDALEVMLTAEASAKGAKRHATIAEIKGLIAEKKAALAATPVTGTPAAVVDEGEGDETGGNAPPPPPPAAPKARGKTAPHKSRK